ncbi:osteomodulin [Spea bombifrons]|uniref:osteomodulin n=1 Tax=Spea bombifrons TaxID=233779 RepID=UPI00234B1C81|nr:osteomodulin [Spea bombifrons]
MGIPIHFLIVTLLWGTRGLCQYNIYDYDEDDGLEHENQYPPHVPLTHNVDYGVPHFPYSTDCARECFCPPAFPLTMYCDNRKLKTIPKIPSRIHQLHLQYNEIESVTASSFINATSLTEINLSHNKIMSDKIEVGAFTKIPHLTQLFLNYNELDEIPSPLPSSTERLHLGFNKINKVRENDFQGLVNLTMLDLCNNQIETIKGKALTKPKSLMQLNICNNKLHSMPVKLPASLMYLSLENNSISEIPGDYFTNLPNLQAIRMSHNQLKEIPVKMFDLPNLVELNVGHNKLKHVFFVPRSLEHLYLQDNEIDILNITLMCPAINPMNTNRLTYLRVDQNKLKAPISTYAFLCYPHIQSIYYGEQKHEPHIQSPLIPQYPMTEDEEDYDRETIRYHGYRHVEDQREVQEYHQREHEEDERDAPEYREHGDVEDGYFDHYSY